jgi:uncharacterized protein YbjT (DUF2867 family)
MVTTTRTAIVLGASGSVGAALLRTLLHDSAFSTVITLGRRSQPEAVTLARAQGHELREQLVPDMTPAALEAATMDALRSIDGDVVGFSVLGIGAGTANMTLDEHRAIDVALNAAFARGLRASGVVRHLCFMSAAGANAKAKTSGSGAAGMPRYNRVKGESEEAVRAEGPAVVSVFRPAMIIGSTHTPPLLARLLPLVSFMTPARYRSITVEQIAHAMVATAKATPAASAVYHYAEMMEAR